MIVTVHHTKHYDWQPVPPQVGKTEIEAGRANGTVRADSSGEGWLMQVPVARETFTTIHVTEEDIFHTLFHKDVRPLRLNRNQAIALHLTKYRLPQHTHQRWVTKVEVECDEPDPSVIKKLLELHVEAGNIEADEVNEHLVAYKAESPSVVDHLRTTFKLKGAA